MQASHFENILEGKGGKFLFVHCPHLQVSIASVWFEAGSIYDPLGKEGLAHFFEHLLLQKTKKEPSRTQRLYTLESRGIDFYAYTNKDSAYYYHIQEPEKTKESLGLLALGIADFVFDETDIEKERNVILSEKDTYDGNRDEKVWDFLFDGLYHGSVFAHNPFGDAHSISSITKEDIEKFYREYYNLENAVWVILSPQVSGADEKIHLEETLRPFVDASEKVLIDHSARETMGSVHNQRAVASSEDTSFLVAEAFHTTDIFDQENILRIDLLRSIIASGWISWANKILRTEKSLIYWARSAFSQFHDRGYVAFFFDVQSASKNQAITLFNRLVEDSKNIEKMSEHLDAHKNAFATRFLRVYHNPEDLLWWYGYPALFGIVKESPKEYLHQLKQLKAEELVSVAEKTFTKEKRSVIEIS